MKKILYLEPVCGISGDMLAGALLELVDNKEQIFEKIYSLKTFPGFRLNAYKINKNGIIATKFDVEIENEAHSHDGHHGRMLEEIFNIINSAEMIPDKAKELACRIFKRLADAESKIHGMEEKYVHFHEVGAVDSIVDITIASLLLCELGIDEVVSIPPALGSGSVNTMHGVLPVPAPATAQMLKGLPFSASTVQGELTTPTGAAILAETVKEWMPPRGGRLAACGYGAGAKNFSGHPNVLRATIIESEFQNSVSDSVAVINANIDDMPGEFSGRLFPELLDIGALDVCIIPVMMKKGRPGMIIEVIAPVELIDKISDFLTRNTTTIGVRYRIQQRKILNRSYETVSTSFGDVAVKISGSKEEGTYKVKPEIEDIERIAKSGSMGFNMLYNQIVNEINNKLC